MSKPTKVILGIATLWPGAYLVFFFVSWFYLLFRTLQESDGRGPPTGFFVTLFVLHGITILWIFALLAVYLTNIFKNQRVANDKKALWAVALFLGNVIAMPVYWY